MRTISAAQHNHPVLYAIKTLFNKLVQHPEVYPIKYYKKGTRYRRNRKPKIV